MSAPAGGRRVLVSAAEPYLGAARQELREAFPAATVEGLGPDVAVLVGVPVEEVAERCRAAPLAFPRHLAAVHATVGGDDPAALLAAVRAAAADAPDGPLGLQVWASGEAGARAEEVRARVADALAADGRATARAGAATVLGVCLTAGRATVALTPAGAGLTDWPGGRVRLSRPREQVSRAEFKLEELLKLVPGLAAGGGRALDLGAAPGGWTRVLRAHGFEVWAVDPGEMHPRLLADPGVHHVPTTAGPFLDGFAEPLDLLVNDMRMDPARSVALVVRAAAALRPGAHAVTTLKIAPRKPVATVRAALRRLHAAYDVELARQLFHNRNEVTVVARRR